MLWEYVKKNAPIHETGLMPLMPKLKNVMEINNMHADKEIEADKAITELEKLRRKNISLYWQLNALSEREKVLVEALQDADLWIPQMREAVGCGLFFQDARMANLEAWHKDIKATLKELNIE